MTHIIKAEVGLKCPQATLRSAASIQEKTHFTLFFHHPKVWSSKLRSVCEEGQSILKPIMFFSIIFIGDTELSNLIMKSLTPN